VIDGPVTGAGAHPRRSNVTGRAMRPAADRDPAMIGTLPNAGLRDDLDMNQGSSVDAQVRSTDSTSLGRIRNPVGRRPQWTARLWLSRHGGSVVFGGDHRGDCRHIESADAQQVVDVPADG